MDEKTSSEAESARETAVSRTVHLADVVELFQDPETETASEGYAKVWHILAEDESYYTLVVSFMNDPAYPDRKVTRKYRKRKP